MHEKKGASFLFFFQSYIKGGKVMAIIHALSFHAKFS